MRWKGVASSIALIICLSAFPVAGGGQPRPRTNPSSANAVPSGPSFDVWPEVVIHDNDWHNYQCAALGRDPNTRIDKFVVWGLDEESPCGFRKVIISTKGIVHADTGAFVGDDGTDFWKDAACENVNPFGFFCGVTADEATGHFVGSGIGFELKTLQTWAAARGIPLSGFDYFPRDEDYAIFQRFDRDGNPITPVIAGRNIPAGTHESDPNWQTRSRSRSLNGAVLSNGNMVCCLIDRSNDSPAAAFGLGGQNINLYTIFNADASEVIVDTTPVHTADSGGMALSGQDQKGTDASSKGWWVQVSQAGGGSIAFFRNDGTRFAERQGYASDWPDNSNLMPGGVGSVLTNDRQREVAAGGDFCYIATLYEGIDGIRHPAYLQYWVNATDGTTIPFWVIQADNDAPRTTSIRPDHVSISATNRGTIAVMWRHDDGAPVARVFGRDGHPCTSSFYVSDLADPTQDNTALTLGSNNDNASVECAVSSFGVTTTVCATWITDNGVTTSAGDNCCGAPKAPAVSVAARIFIIGVDDVDDWSLY